MRLTAACFLILIAVVGCDRASDSFVGAESLPSVEELARETIQINRDSAVGRQQHYLSYELKPDNSVTVTHSLDNGGDQIVGSETLRLARDQAAAIREGLRPFRPAQLQGVEYLVYPKGCEPPLDGGMDVAIAFFRGEEIGIFALPYDCKDGYAARARVAYADLMRLLPPSNVAKAFPKST